MSSEPEIVVEPESDFLHHPDPSQWRSSNPGKPRHNPGPPRLRGALDTAHGHSGRSQRGTSHGHGHGHGLGHVSRASGPHDNSQNQQPSPPSHSNAIYVTHPNHSPGRNPLMSPTPDAPSQPQSPINAHRTVTQTESDASSQNVRFGQLHLNGDRNGFQPGPHTHNSSSQKRTTDQMQDPRPTKQMFSPSDPRGPQSFYHNSPPQSSLHYRYGGNHEAGSPVPLSPTLGIHDHPFVTIGPERSKQFTTSPPLSPSSGGLPFENQFVKQPATRPITEQQLINEVKGIYAGLVMVERKCVDIIQQQTNSTKRLTDQQWKALVALHRTLLQEHHDFFSASQHPTASDNLKKLAIKYAMPARMWRHGIHAFLELLRHRLPESMEHMLSFIYLAYSMIALLKESVPNFVETWIECLGDLARYRMAIEDTDPRDREIWSNVAKMWYNEAADKSPNVGRIQHHLAVLARPNIVEQLFYYDKALVSVIPFVNARESIMLLFDMFVKNGDTVRSRYPPTEFAFVNTYAKLFTRRDLGECRYMLEYFGSSFSGHMDRTGPRFKLQGPQMAIALFAGLQDFGKEDAHLWQLYWQQMQQEEADRQRRVQANQNDNNTVTDRQLVHATQQDYWRNLTPESEVVRIPLPSTVHERDIPNSSEVVVGFAASLTFQNITLVASRMGDKNGVPFMHVILANVYGMSFVPGALPYIERCIPWAALVVFLNTIGRSGISYANAEGDIFPPSHGGHGKQLPEDFLMRGMMSTRHYYEPDFFAGVLVDEDERTIELPSHQAPRVERCLWLGVQLAKLGRYISYDVKKKEFDTTAFARSLSVGYI